MANTLMTRSATLALTMISPVCARLSKPMYRRWIARRSRGDTGQPGRQLNGTSRGASGPDTAAVNLGSLVRRGVALGVARCDHSPAAGPAAGCFAAGAALGRRALAQPAAATIATTPANSTRLQATSTG